MALASGRVAVVARALRRRGAPSAARGLASRAHDPDAEVFESADEHRAFLATRAALPDGFRTATASFPFEPVELARGKKTRMSLTAIVLDEPTEAFAGVFTQNAFPGHPVRVGRRRLKEEALSAIVINNKISNVGAPGGEADSEAVCAAFAHEMGTGDGTSVIPCSTGIIGWRLPVDDMTAAIPALVDELQGGTGLPLAMGIMTTDMYPKLRSVTLEPAAEGEPPVRVMGVAKGAGMVEPNLATMLVYILTDADISREQLRAALPAAAHSSFNCLSVDGDQSTSDTLIAAASGRRRLPGATDEERAAAFQSALQEVCDALSMDVVRNGEGVQHVMRVNVLGAATEPLARRIGKKLVNSLLVKTAVAGNDPNVGRLVMAVGNGLSEAAAAGDQIDTEAITSRMRISVGGCVLFEDGKFVIDGSVEKEVHDHLMKAWLWESVPQITSTPVPVDTSVGDESRPPAWFVRGNGVSYQVPVDVPRHQRCVEIEVDLASGEETCTVLGNDLTHEYVSVNADYRS